MRAKPILGCGLVAGALALPGPALALGLGKLTIESSLGQPLAARIELTSASKEELDSLSARVADPSLYRDNNLAYQTTLSRARIALITAGGTPFLHVTSPVSVVEPYLDLLVELNWASGRIVREYTFLLDPPGTGATAIASEPIQPARTGSAPARTQPLASAPSPQARAAATDQGGTQYTVQRGDTLSKIANQYKPPEVTLEQMLVALFNGNEAAFEGRNMNRLRAGTIVTIPQSASIAATQGDEANRIVRAQAADWRAYRDRVAGTAPTTEGTAGREAGGRIGTAVTDNTPAAALGRDQLRVSREAARGKGPAAEDLVARDQQLRETQSRVAELEKTVRDMQRALELKNETLAQLQAQVDAAKGKAAEPTKAPSAGTPTAPIVTAKAPEPKPIAEPIKAPEAAKAPEPVKAPVETPKAETTPPSAAPSTATPPAAATPTPVPVPAKAPEAAPKPPVAKAPPKAPSPPETNFLEDLLGGTPLWAVGVGVLAILGGLVALIATRRRKTTKFEDSIISGTDIKTNTVFGSTGGGVVNTGDNSLSSDFSREGLGNIDTDEVDPIAEAEVYLAYGRDAQAEEILKDALKKDPQRQEIYLKLLEIHAQHNKPSAFETVAAELYAVTQGQGEVWQKAVALGRQLDPNNPMFAEGGMTAAPSGEEVSTAHPDISLTPEHALDNMIDEEISISPSSGQSTPELLAGAHGLEESDLAAADLHKPEEPAATTASAAAATAALAGALAASKAASAPSAPMDKAEATDDFNLDFHLDEAEKPAPMKPRAEPKPEPALTVVPGGSGAAPAPQLSRPAAALELDKLDLSFDPERSTFEDPTPSVLDGQWHDAATKLDLAKAYQEMGDAEGAREILQEVLHEGDDQQKGEAQALLAKLA